MDPACGAREHRSSTRPAIYNAPSKLARFSPSRRGEDDRTGLRFVRRLGPTHINAPTELAVTPSPLSNGGDRVLSATCVESRAPHLVSICDQRYAGDADVRRSVQAELGTDRVSALSKWDLSAVESERWSW
jgi:hypothetical protein